MFGIKGSLSICHLEVFHSGWYEAMNYGLSKPTIIRKVLQITPSTALNFHLATTYYIIISSVN